MRKDIFLYIIFIISIGLISAIPGIPHQFYGSVVVNGQPALGNIITASVNGQEYVTISYDGVYGINPNTFFVEDINSNNYGKTINFYVGGKLAGSYIFKNSQLTKLDFSLETTCGDSYCLGDETCSSCSNDCGECEGASEIIILSPENKVYDNPKIDLNVYSSQDILIWMYSINSETPKVFVPNITLTLNDGNYELEVIGINSAYQTNSKKISFSVDVPYDYCGDGICNNGETCSICSADCGKCSSSSSKGSSGSRYTSSKINTSEVIQLSPNEEATSEVTNENSAEIPVVNEETTDKENTEEISDKKSFFSRITGAAISEGNTGTIIKLGLGILAIIILLIFIFKLLKHKRKPALKPALEESIIKTE